MRKPFKLIAIIVIEAVLCLDCAWATQTMRPEPHAACFLSPSLQLDSSGFQSAVIRFNETIVADNA
ncbi:MAG: hypothetical protein KJ647_05920, partial [Candidatus Omnitrophica bacterium]|nr:hypothetical protein [Candidatus Omnitrophota bacterium]